MKKKALKITAAAAAVLIIVFILSIYNAFCGNIFSAMYAKNQIEKYIDKTYPDNNYDISDAKFNFKFGEYNCRITDPDSADGSFTATYESDGNITDSYKNVTDLDNTLMRLDDEFRKDIEPLLDRYFDENGKEFGFGTVIEDKEADKSKLYLDMKADPKNMPIKTYIVVSFESNSNKSLGRIQTIAKDLKTLGYRIDYYSFFDNDNYFQYVPTQELLDAASIADLVEYKLADETPKDKY